MKLSTSRIIALCGGPKAVASITGRHVASVYRWQRTESIPFRHCVTPIGASRGQVSAEAFVDAPGPGGGLELSPSLGDRRGDHRA